MKKIILDVDTGIDDALAILFALGDKNAELIGITTTYGNVDLKMANENTLRILDLVNEKDVPVYMGSSHKLTEKTFSRRQITEKIHGVDGIGDVEIPATLKEAEKQDAIDFLIESAEKYQDDLTIIAVGPLTNMARVLDKNQKAFKNIHEIVVMGGALTVPGNTTPYAEANFYEDPVAANKLLKTNLPVRIVGLDVTMRTILTAEHTNELKMQETKASEVVVKMIEHYFKAYRARYSYISGCALHDPLAVGVALYPELVRNLPIYVAVDEKKPSTGRLIADMERLTTENPQTEICLQVDDQKFLDLFIENLKNIL